MSEKELASLAGLVTEAVAGVARFLVLRFDGENSKRPSLEAALLEKYGAALGNVYPSLRISTSFDSNAAAAELQLVLLPIDGWLNFTRAIPYWATACVLFHQGAAVHGVVAGPDGKLFVASSLAKLSRGIKRLNDVPTVKLRHAVVSTEFSQGVATGSIAQHSRILADCASSRGFGSLSLEIAWVAAGRLDALVCYQPSLEIKLLALLFMQQVDGICVDLKSSDLASNYNPNVANSLLIGSSALIEEIRTLNCGR